MILAACDGSQSALDPGGPDAHAIALLSQWMFAAGAFVFVVTVGMLLVAVSLGRTGARQLSFRRSAIVVLIGGVAAPIVAIVAVAASGALIGDETEGAQGPEGPEIVVAGRMWWWEFRYLDDDGEVIAVTANELHLPVGERARLRLVSDNVIHSFWAPNLQGKTDLIPGVENVLFFQPDAPGTWRAQCAEFCGLQHGLMGGLVIAEPRAEYDAWLAGQAADAAVTEGPGFDAFMDLGCGECHTIRGTAAAGEAGPDLTHLASRRTLAAATLPNTPGNLGGWITDTHSVKPGAKMPASVPKPERLHALIRFLGALE